MASYFATLFPTVEGGYSVSIFEFPEVCTEGTDLEDAIFMANDALSISIEEYTRERREIPKPLAFEEVKKRALAEIEENKDCLDLSRDVHYQFIKAPSVETKPVKIMVSFPKNVLEQIDKKAEALGLTRSKLLANGALAYEG